MAHYKRMFDDKEHLYAFDLDGRDVTLQIEKVVAGELAGEKGRKTKKPMISFVGARKKLAINKTNGKTIASLYGNDTDGWTGRWITIFPTTTDFGGETVECIRVRPQVPQPRAPKGNGKDRGAAKHPEAQPAETLVVDPGAAAELSDADKRAIEAAERAEQEGGAS